MSGPKIGGEYGPQKVIALNGATGEGRQYILASGDAIATYCPADGSVVPVSAGDRLFDGNIGELLTARTHGAVTRWGGELLRQDVDYSLTAIAANSRYRVGLRPAFGRVIFLTNMEGHFDQLLPTPASNYFTWTIEFNNATVATQSFQNDATDTQVRKSLTINTEVDLSDIDAVADSSGAKAFASLFTETGTQQLISNGSIYGFEVHS